jgi:hypothetical protein
MVYTVKQRQLASASLWTAPSRQRAVVRQRRFFSVSFPRRPIRALKRSQMTVILVDQVESQLNDSYLSFHLKTSYDP